jgi:hypothetical protein
MPANLKAAADFARDNDVKISDGDGVCARRGINHLFTNHGHYSGGGNQDDPELTLARLAQVQGVITIIASGLALLGVEAPKEMR